MTGRILLTGVVGGVVMFIWTSIAHMVLPLGQVGVREMPNEAAVIEALHSNLGDTRGLYIYPGLGVGPNATREDRSRAMKNMAQKLASTPSGILMYNWSRPLNLPRLLSVEFATEVAEAILVVALLAQTRLTSFSGRVAFVTAAGIVAAIATNISYWNWYGFPKRYTAAYMFIQVVGFLLVGAVAGLLSRRNEPA